MEDSGRFDIFLQTGSDGLDRPEFQKFPKIPRFYRDIIITEKIDGTNAQVLVTEDGRVFAGSRNRWLASDQPDNYGFRAWVEEHADELRQLGPGRHFGEWWGKGINRGYGLDHRRFSLFNVSRWQSLENSGHRLTKFERGEEVNIERTYPPACCGVVPILYVGPWKKELDWGEEKNFVRDTLFDLGLYGSRAVLDFMRPEGIVIYHTAGHCLFKVTFEGDQPKGKRNDPATTR